MLDRFILHARLAKTLTCLVILLAQNARAANPIQVPLTAAHWRIESATLGDVKPDVQFARHEGFPEGVLVLKSGSATLEGLTFRNGTIEFDIKGLGQDIPGITFRQQGTSGTENAEEFYVRTLPECRASNDCIQYAPVINGYMLWNSYPQYQKQALILDGWNHIKLVVSGRRMNVYINRVSEPALIVGSLEGSSLEGAIEFRGPAMYANLTVTRDALEGLPTQPTPDPTSNDRGIVRQWQLGSLTPWRKGDSVSYTNKPDDGTTWTSVTAGRFGLVNLNHNFIFATRPSGLAWLRSDVTSRRDQMKHVSLGWWAGRGSS